MSKKQARQQGPVGVLAELQHGHQRLPEDQRGLHRRHPSLDITKQNQATAGMRSATG